MSSPTTTTLPNGLRVITEPIGGIRSVSIGIWVRTGSRYESDSEAGIAHFIEHLLFKGTPSHSARDIAERFDGLGGEVNAATGRDYTVFYARILDEHLDEAAPVLADMLQHPGFYELDQEREVVIEEIAMYDDDPQDKVHELIGAAVFPGQPLGRPVIGTSQVIGAVSHSEVAAYFDSHYTTPNTVVAASGAVDHERIVDLASRLFSDMSRGSGARRFEPAAPGTPRLAVESKATEQFHVAFGASGLARDDRRRHAHSVLDTILGGSMSSRLFQEVRERRGLAYSVGSYSTSYTDTGQIGIYLGTRPDNLVSACEVVAQELARLGDQLVDDRELSRAKEHLRGRLVLSLESPTMRMNRIGRALVTDAEQLTIDEHLARLSAVSAADVRSLAREFWRPERFSLAVIGPDPQLVERAAEVAAPQARA